MTSPSALSILVADDDAEDRELIRDALREARLSNPIQFAVDGEELLQELNSGRALPALILLDLNMPKKGGMEAIRAIKSDSRLKRIPIIVLTTSKADEDIARSYDLGVSSFVTKPVTFSDLVRVVGEIAHYWFELVELPKDQTFA